MPGWGLAGHVLYLQVPADKWNVQTSATARELPAGAILDIADAGHAGRLRPGALPLGRARSLLSHFVGGPIKCDMSKPLENPRSRRPHQPMHRRKCWVCGVDFIAARTHALTCGSKCRKVRQRLRAAAKLEAGQ